MRAWLLSDLHQEFVRDPQASRHPETAFDPLANAPDDFDVVVLAGDIDVPLTASILWIAERFAGVPVIVTPGNHDFYVGGAADQKFTIDEMRQRGRDLGGELGIHLLDDTSVVIDGVRFVGGTLWTDFGLGHGTMGHRIAEAAGRYGMGDYRHIRRWSTKQPGKRKRMRPEDTIALHRRTRTYIETELAVPFNGPTVVVTHHAPSARSLDDFYKGQLDWCYASDLDAMMHAPTAPDIWMHGHIHECQDYVVGNTRVVSNPRGYRFVSHEQRLGFDPCRVIDLDDPSPVAKL